MDNKINFKPNENFDINDMVNQFCDLLKKNIIVIEENKNPNINHEIELTIYNPDIIRTLSNFNQFISTFENDKYFKENFIEKTYTQIISNGQKVKHRSKIDWKELESMRLSNKSISVIESIWEKKTLISIYEHYKESNNLVKYDIKYSIEEKDIKNFSSDYLTGKNIIRLYSVNSIHFIYKSKIKVSLRDKVFIGSGNEQNSTYYKFISKPELLKKHSSWYVELEYVHNNKEIKIEEIKNDVTDCLCLIYGVKNINNIRLLKYNTPNIINTYFISIDDLLKKNESNILITTKIDGDKVDFKVKESICYMLLGNMMYLLKTTIDPKISFEGVAEYIKINGKKELYPFYFRKINNKMINDREESFKKYKKIIYNHKVSSEIETDLITVDKQADYPLITFRYKTIYGPFENKEDYMNSVYLAFNEKTEYDKDGIIIMDKKNNNNPTDEKYKQDNTVDVVTYIKPCISQRKDGRYIEVKMFKYKNKNKEEFKTENVKNNDDFTFDDILSYVKIKNNKSNGPKYYLCPYILIYEYSLLYNKMIQPRLIKTNNLYYSNYLGNNYDVITKSEDLHNFNKVPSVEIFKELSKKYDIKKLYNLFDNEDKYLNSGKTEYFLRETKRISLNYITNFIKTQSMFSYFSPISTDDKYNKEKSNYLSIDIGRGGDLQKYFYVNAKTLTGTDPDENALNECRRRHNDLKKSSRSNLFKLDLKKIYFNDKNYISEVTNNGITKFKGIDWNLAIHYSWKKNKFNEITKKIYDLLQEGGKILITTLDGERIKREFEKNNTDKIEFNIENNKILFLKNKDSEDNDIIKVFISSMTSESKDEYLINIEELITIFESQKLILLDYNHFDIVKKYYDNFNILSVMRNQKELSKHYYFKNLTNAKIEDNSDLERLTSLYISLVFEKN